jgi:hypothetical protein
MLNRCVLILLASGLFAADRVSKPGAYTGYSECVQAAERMIRRACREAIADA